MMGFTSKRVALAVSDLPTGVTGDFSPNPATSGSTPAWTSVLTLTAASDATLGGGGLHRDRDQRDSERLRTRTRSW